jgi:hypothetical protein
MSNKERYGMHKYKILKYFACVCTLLENMSKKVKHKYITLGL